MSKQTKYIEVVTIHKKYVIGHVGQFAYAPEKTLEVALTEYLWWLTDHNAESPIDYENVTAKELMDNTNYWVNKTRVPIFES